MSHAAIQLRAMRAILDNDWAQSVFTHDELRTMIWTHAATLLSP